MICYKIVSDHKDGLTSFLCDEDMSHSYAPGQTTNRTSGWGPLAAFATKDHAVSWMKQEYKFKTIPFFIRLFLSIGEGSESVGLWFISREGDIQKSSRYIPNCLFMDSITLVKEVEFEHIQGSS